VIKTGFSSAFGQAAGDGRERAPFQHIAKVALSGGGSGSKEFSGVGLACFMRPAPEEIHGRSTDLYRPERARAPPKGAAALVGEKERRKKRRATLFGIAGGDRPHWGMVFTALRLFRLFHRHARSGPKTPPARGGLGSASGFSVPRKTAGAAGAVMNEES